MNSTAKKAKVSVVGKLVDEYGAISAQVAELERRKGELRAVLAASVTTSAEGKLFRVTVSTVNREVVDMDAVRQVLSPEFLANFTKVSSSVAVRCTAKTGK